MTREEQIKKQVYIYTNDASNYIEWNDDGFYTNDIDLVEKAFIEGAKWTDNNTKSPWISVNDDLPCNHKKLTHSNYTDRVIVLARNEFPEVEFMYKVEEGVWEWTTLKNVSYWMPIPKLPDNKNNNQ